MTSTTIHGVSQLLLDILFPPACPSCHVPVDTMHNLCGECFTKLRMIAHPLCGCCGIPFVVAAEGDMHCPECLDTPPAFTRARSVMVYDGISAPLISALKFYDQWAGLERYTAMLCATGAGMLATADIIAPVPLHWRRLWWRKYNQSALLAYGVSRRANLPCIPDLLYRTRYTKPQMRLKRSERLRNVKGVFALTAAHAPTVVDKHIVLVDDVITTGSTVEACAAVLKKAGAREVSVLTLARTVRE